MQYGSINVLEKYKLVTTLRCSKSMQTYLNILSMKIDDCLEGKQKLKVCKHI